MDNLGKDMQIAMVYKTAAHRWEKNFKSYCLNYFNKEYVMTDEFKTAVQNAMQEARDPYVAAREICGKFMRVTVEDNTVSEDIELKMYRIMGLLNLQDKIMSKYPAVLRPDTVKYGATIKELADKGMCLEDAAIAYLNQHHPDWETTEFTEEEQKHAAIASRVRIDLFGEPDFLDQLRMLADLVDLRNSSKNQSAA